MGHWLSRVIRAFSQTVVMQEHRAQTQHRLANFYKLLKTPKTMQNRQQCRYVMQLPKQQVKQHAQWP